MLTTEIPTYWQDGNGDPFTGGAFGCDIEWQDADGNVTATCTTRPNTAVTIDKPTYDALEAAYLATWSTEAIGGGDYLTAEQAAQQALKQSAQAKLVSGTPLTADEAAAIAGNI